MEPTKSLIEIGIYLMPKEKQLPILAKQIPLAYQKQIKSILILTSRRPQLRKRNIVVVDMEAHVLCVKEFIMKENFTEKLILLLEVKNIRLIWIHNY
jgi:hypothetical protein